MTTASTNAELEARYRAVLPSYLAPLYEQPISIDRGEGSFVWDVEGNRYMDWFGGVLTTMVGHSQPEVVAAVQAQAAKVMHTSSLYLSEPMIGLAEEIAALIAFLLGAEARFIVGSVMFVDGGTDAQARPDDWPMPQ